MSPQRLSLNPPTGLWDRRLGSVGRWAGACVRAGAFWGVQDWGAGLVRVGGGWGGSALRRALWAAQMSWGRLRIRCRAVVKVFCQGQLSGRRSLCRPLWLTRRPGTVRSRLRMVAATVSWRAGWVRPRRAVQRARLCASTQQASQAPLAGCSGSGIVPGFGSLITQHRGASMAL